MGKPRKTCFGQISGSFRVHKVYEDGREVWEPWTDNLIVDTIAPVISGSIIGEPTFGAAPNLFYAVGTDNTAESINDVALGNEVFRKAIVAADLDYLDPLTDSCVASRSAKIQVRLRLGLNEGMVAMEEYGVFGGDATIAFDSGYMMNHVVIPLNDRTTVAPLEERFLRWTF